LRYLTHNAGPDLADAMPVGQLCSTRGTRVACGPVEGFMRPSLGFRCSIGILQLTTFPCFDNLEFDVFDAGGPQCHFITSVTIAVRIWTLSVY